MVVQARQTTGGGHKRAAQSLRTIRKVKIKRPLVVLNHILQAYNVYQGSRSRLLQRRGRQRPSRCRARGRRQHRGNCRGRSTSGSLILFGGGPIDWSSALQPVVACSSAESEHISAFNASRSIVYYRQFLEELGYNQYNNLLLEMGKNIAKCLKK